MQIIEKIFKCQDFDIFWSFKSENWVRKTLINLSHCINHVILGAFMKLFKILALILSLGLFPSLANAERLVAKVSLKKQTMTIMLDEEMIYKWSVSTGKKDFETPPGFYNAQRKYTMWHSRTYDNAPMPFAVFFYNGYAVHGTNALKMLGKPASHGCVRVTTPNAKIFYELVDEVGLGETLVEIAEE